MDSVLQFLSQLRVRKTSTIQSVFIFLNSHFTLMKFERTNSATMNKEWNIFWRVPYFTGTLSG